MEDGKQDLKRRKKREGKRKRKRFKPSILLDTSTVDHNASSALETRRESRSSTPDIEVCDSVDEDPDVPPLTRTDSIFLTKEYLYLSRQSNESEVSSCVESTDEYNPSKDSRSESSSDGSSDLSDKLPLKKKKTKPSDECAPIGCSTPNRGQQMETENDDLKSEPPPSKRKRQIESNYDEPVTDASTSKKSQQARVHKDVTKSETSTRRSWSKIEIRAVEKTLTHFIESGKVPGKADCVACTTASPEALKSRSWTALLCPKCSAKLGSFSWFGDQCSCGRWVTPAFQLHHNRVDEIRQLYKQKEFTD